VRLGLESLKGDTFATLTTAEGSTYRVAGFGLRQPAQAFTCAPMKTGLRDHQSH
jgi:hypothetical protein